MQLCALYCIHLVADLTVLPSAVLCVLILLIHTQQAYPLPCLPAGVAALIVFNPNMQLCYT
jgi:hypothetical protein